MRGCIACLAITAECQDSPQSGDRREFRRSCETSCLYPVCPPEGTASPPSIRRLSGAGLQARSPPVIRLASGVSTFLASGAERPARRAKDSSKKTVSLKLRPAAERRARRAKDSSPRRKPSGTGPALLSSPFQGRKGLILQAIEMSQSLLRQRILPACLPLYRLLGASMGPRARARGIRSKNPFTASVISGFNEAASARSRNWRETHLPRREDRGFNEAASARSRNSR